jgi:predicted ATP-dependent endonuclease of OLD family
MKLTVKNLGAIKNGEISFDKKLIIFTGPNNTGKSYLTYLIHAIHNLSAFIDDAKSVSMFDDYFSDDEPIIKMAQNGLMDINTVIEAYNEDFNKVITQLISDNLLKIFASTNIKPDIQLTIKKLDYKLYSPLPIVGYKIDDNQLFSFWGDGSVSEKPNKHVASTAMIKIYAQVILGMLLKGYSPFGKSYIFPSERASINLFSKDIVAKKAGSRDDMAIRVLGGEDIAEIARSISQEQNLNPKYSMAINDYINFVYEFQDSSSLSSLSYLADDLESTILDGTISISKFKQLIFKPKNTDATLSLHESSSLVKSLSFLVIYLRHFATVGDWVIIDEPEINLHPNLQVAIAKIFARMINSGLKVIISTHSDYLVKELNSLLMLHDLSEDKKQHSFIKKQGYITADLLDKKEVGAYYINNGKVTPIDIEGEGIVVPSIDKTIASIDNFTEEVFFKLKTLKLSKTSKKTKSNEPE